MSPSLKGLLMDKGRGTLENALKVKMDMIETIEQAMRELTRQFNAPGNHYVSLYMNKRKREEIDMVSLVWRTTHKLSGESENNITRHSKFQVVNYKAVLNPDIKKIITSDKEEYNRVLAFEHTRLKLNYHHAAARDSTLKLLEYINMTSMLNDVVQSTDLRKQSRSVDSDIVGSIPSEIFIP